MAQNTVEKGDSTFELHKTSNDDVRRQQLQSEVDSLDGDAQTLRITSYVLMGVGVAVAGGAVGAWLYEPDPGEAALSVTPGGVWVRGSF